MLGLDRLLQKSPGTIAQNLLQGVIPVWCIECNDITITQAVYSSVGCDPARSSNKIHRSPLSSYTRNDHISSKNHSGHKLCSRSVERLELVSGCGGSCEFVAMRPGIWPAKSLDSAYSGGRLPIAGVLLEILNVA